MSIIRRLEIGEAALYRGVRLESLRESPEAFVSRYEDALARGWQSWVDQADGSAAGRDRATFVAMEEGGAVGLAALYRDAEDADAGELIQMWVAPEKRGGAEAGGLLEEIFRWAGENGFARVKAEVVAGNARALVFYGKHGFAEVCEGAGHPDGNVVLTREVGSTE